jgi:hypothetical protein
LIRALSTLFAGWSVLALAGAAAAQQTARLEAWETRARLIPNPGPGERLFQIQAEVTWPRSLSRSAEDLAVRVVLPDGRVSTRSIPPQEGPGSSLLTVYVPVDAVRNRPPDQVIVRASIIDGAGNVLSNELTATIDDFPTPASGNPPADPGPFGWGRPLRASTPAILPRPGPDGLRFVRVPASPEIPAYFLATTEATNRQLTARLPDYAPPANRSDEFALEGPDQPAFGLSPAQAQEYLAALSRADRAGVRYRLPTRAEWLRAARAGQASAFWWGDAATHPEGANFLGPEPALAADATATLTETRSGEGYQPNPWGFLHTFGNVEEWATTGDDGRFVRLGGHFRTEPPPAETAATAQETGPDLFVGVRPAFSLSASEANAAAQRVFSTEKRLADVRVNVDVDRMTAELTGTVPESSLRRLADRQLAALWWLAAVENRLETPRLKPGQLARLGQPAGAASGRTVLGRSYTIVPIAVRWADRLPVTGSDWWVNLSAASGGEWSYRLDNQDVGGRRPLPLLIDRSRFGPDANLSVYLSLGAPGAANAVTEPVSLRVPNRPASPPPGR